MDTHLTDRRFQYSIWTFNDREIEQVAALIRLWGRGGQSGPVDRRRYTKTVQEWAKAVGILETFQGRGQWHGRLVFTRDAVFWPIYQSPPEAIWRLADPIIGERSGYSIAREKGWLDFGIAPAGHRYHDERDEREIFAIMHFLDTWHYIHFQSAGTIWQVTRRQQEDTADERTA